MDNSLYPKAKITLEEKETLAHFKDSDSFKTVIKLLNVLADAQATEVLQVDLNVKSDRDLAFAKTRAEGAARLARAFHETILKYAKPVKNDESV